MEAPLVVKSRSRFLNLTNLESLNDYTNLLAKIYNNPHKYAIIDGEIKVDTFGDPYITFQYSDIENLEETQKPKATFFGEIIFLRSNLEIFDQLTDDHVAQKIKILFAKDYTTKDKTNPVMYRLVIYMQAIKGETINQKDITSVIPKTAF